MRECDYASLVNEMIRVSSLAVMLGAILPIFMKLCLLHLSGIYVLLLVIAFAKSAFTLIMQG